MGELSGISGMSAGLGGSSNATGVEQLRTISLARQKQPMPSMLVGKAKRNPITGEVVLQNMKDFPDFYVVDLMRRRRLSSSLEELKADPWLFRPIPLAYRTWLFHEASTADIVAPGTDGSGLLRMAFDSPCIDRAIPAGRWSSMMCFVPLVPATGLTGDVVLVFVTIFVTILLYATSCFSNNERAYRYERFFSLAIRLPFLIFLFVRFNLSDVLTVAGFVLVILACLIDFYLGDVAAVSNFGMHCSYVILKELPARVFVCRRDGAASMEGDSKFEVDERICGFSPWKPSHVLIADIGGLLVELRPMLAEDWRLAADMFSQKHAPLPYVGLNAFGGHPDMDEDWVEGGSEEGGSRFDLSPKAGGRRSGVDNLTVEEL